MHRRAVVLPALAIAGPTASGKSALALALAQGLQQQGLAVEIISVDSAQIYRGLDIGSAKPSAAERAAVPQHLIDILEPEASYSVARFVADVQQCISSIQQRAALPLLVGGTMLYFKALREGLSPMPASDLATRAAIEAEAASAGWPALHAELQAVDPSTAARLAPNDSQRIGRALEVWRASGRPLSAWHAEATAAALPALPMLSLEPRSRAWLHERIAQRFEAMLAAGFVDEVRALRQRPGLHASLPSMRCVGYRQAWEALDAEAAGVPQALSTLRGRGIAATRQLAKRQLTWLRSMGATQRWAPDEATPAALLEQAVRWVQRSLPA
jgi:tRNA dimethylallyltransferase